ncbi:MAG: hypothetical protein NVSMB56_18830 [Pyrinomonadaceae bacterium]
MSVSEQELLTKQGICSRCDRESEDIVTLFDPDNTEHPVCWSCLARGEKHINEKTHWRRPRRGGIVNNPYENWS